MLDPESRHLLASHTAGSCQLAIVVGDGLSPSAVNAHAVALVRRLFRASQPTRIEIGHAVVACGARVALGDEIGDMLGARMVAVLIGERPGLSAPDSLGAYLTFAPQARPHRRRTQLHFQYPRRGTGYDEAALRIAWLIREGLARKLTGVTLKDESGGAAPGRITNPQPA